MTDTTTAQHLLDGPLSAYRLRAVQHADEGVRLALECPHERERNASGTTCDTNLLDNLADLLDLRERLGTIPLDSLVRLAIVHETKPALERAELVSTAHRRMGELVNYELIADVDVHPFLILECPYVGSRCPGAVEGECMTNLIPTDQRFGSIELGTVLQLAAGHEEARYGVPAARLAELRRRWINRQQTEICTRETADGPSTHIASVRADLYAAVIAELDLAVKGA